MDVIIETLHYDGATGCVVVNGQHKIPASSILRFIDKICLDKGSTLKGRRESFTAITGQRRGVPVYVEEGLILVPDRAASDLDCVWHNWCLQDEGDLSVTSRHIRQFLRKIHASLEV